MLKKTLNELRRRKLISFDVGTNYVPSDGIAYLHQGEAVIPKKYNQPYQPQNNVGMENAINNLVQQVAQISNQVNQGIPVKGQFVQRGSDLVATVERANNRIKNNVLNNHNQQPNRAKPQYCNHTLLRKCPNLNHSFLL